MSRFTIHFRRHLRDAQKWILDCIPKWPAISTGTVCPKRYRHLKPDLEIGSLGAPIDHDIAVDLASESSLPQNLAQQIGQPSDD
jgi:hypothetical protein